MKRIPIRHNGGTRYALVDDADYARLSCHHWWCSQHGYAKREVKIDRKRKIIWMHKVVVNGPDHLTVHHINGVCLDNRRSNLMIASQTENMQGFRKKATDKSSRFRGVSWNGQKSKWTAKVTVNDRVVYAGSYDSELAAAAAYNAKALEIFGDHAGINDLTGRYEVMRAAIERYTFGRVIMPTPMPFPSDEHPSLRPAVVRIPLTGALSQGMFAMIDAEDERLVSGYRWWRTSGYARTHARVNGKKVQLTMHRLIIKAPAGAIIDHINGDKLDNRKANLRFATHQQNTHNSKAKSNKRTGSVFKGVFKQGNGWQASVTVNRKQIYLGFFDTQRQAAQAYNDAAQKYHGEFARLNDLSAVAPEDDPPIRSHQHSRYKGVSWHKKERKWNAYAFVNGRQICIGRFDIEEEAVIARDTYVIEHGLPLKMNLVQKG